MELIPDVGRRELLKLCNEDTELMLLMLMVVICNGGHMHTVRCVPVYYYTHADSFFSVVYCAVHVRSCTYSRL
jgi:hypothetical protein